MAFTNVWDTTFPPDTQLANLLGQDIRSGVKTDVQQRMAAISGLDAAKPRFDLDAQPANWVGILFFALDTGFVYKFVNPGWLNVTGNFLFTRPTVKNVSPFTNTGNTTINNVYLPVIGANVMGAQGVLRVSFEANITLIASGSVTISITFGGALVYAQNLGGGGGVIHGDIYINNVNATNAQHTDAVTTYTPAGGGVVIDNEGGALAIDTTVNQTMALRCQNIGNANNVTTFNRFMTEIL